MVGEGGNLGLTQLGRVEAAQHGVLLNTDFIDNSAGVDTSDHEVNIKILLNAEVQKKRLTLDARNKLLAAMTDEVGHLVLNDNYRQNQAISLMERMSLSRMGSKQHFIRTLEAQGLLDRQIEFLPTDKEIAERKARGQGLTRPELAVLLSYSKIVLFQQLLNSDVPEDAFLSKELVRYFPQAAAGQVRQGDGAAPPEARDHRHRGDQLDGQPHGRDVHPAHAGRQRAHGERSGEGVHDHARSAGRRARCGRRSMRSTARSPRPTQIDALQVIWTLQRAVHALAAVAPGLRSPTSRRRSDVTTTASATSARANASCPIRSARRTRRASATGSPRACRRRSPNSSPRCRTWSRRRTSSSWRRSASCSPVDVAKVHFRLGDALRLPWLQQQIDALAVEGRWHAVARGVLREELGAAAARPRGPGAVDAGQRTPTRRSAHGWSRDDSSLRFTLAMLDETRRAEDAGLPDRLGRGAALVAARLARLTQAHAAPRQTGRRHVDAGARLPRHAQDPPHRARGRHAAEDRSVAA